MGRKDEILRNYKGDIINGIPVLRNPKYGTGKFRITEYGAVPLVDWSQLKDADKDGFDLNHREEGNKYKIEVRLPFGTKLLRYGTEGGRFTAPLGTPYERLSLPYEKETVEYHEYVVIADGIDVICIVEKGIVAQGFDSIGGAVQYVHHGTIEEAIKNNALDRVDLWGDKK